MIDFFDTPLFLRITFWVAIENDAPCYFIYPKQVILQDLSFFTLRESLIFILENVCSSFY